MNREILFRGQTRRHGEKRSMGGEALPGIWVYGGVLPGIGDFSIIYGWEAGVEQTSANLKKFIVYSDTVDQYTGRTAKNGVKIFEGDIVQVENPKPFLPYIRPVVYKDTCFIWGDYILGEYDRPEKLEVIGNIHDNPELLEGGGHEKQRL